MTENTLVWMNPVNGHHYARGPEGASLNGFPTLSVPEWAKGPPTRTYGPLRPWSGGDCPVDPKIEVRCLFRGRRPYLGAAIWPDLPAQLRGSMWRHAPAPGRPDPAMDIIAYQVRVS